MTREVIVRYPEGRVENIAVRDGLTTLNLETFNNVSSLQTRLTQNGNPWESQITRVVLTIPRVGETRTLATDAGTYIITTIDRRERRNNMAIDLNTYMNRPRDYYNDYSMPASSAGSSAGSTTTSTADAAASIADQSRRLREIRERDMQRINESRPSISVSATEAEQRRREMQELEERAAMQRDAYNEMQRQYYQQEFNPLQAPPYSVHPWRVDPNYVNSQTISNNTLGTSIFAGDENIAKTAIRLLAKNLQINLDLTLDGTELIITPRITLSLPGEEPIEIDSIPDSIDLSPLLEKNDD